MTPRTPKTFALIAAFVTLSATLPAQSSIERNSYVGQYFGVNSINAPGTRYDIARDAATLRVFLAAHGATPNVGYRGTTRSSANGSVHAGLLGKRRELIAASGVAESWRAPIYRGLMYVDRSRTAAYLRLLGTTYSHTSALTKRPSSPITYFSKTWFFMAGPVPITIYGNVRGDYLLSIRASVSATTRGTSVSAYHGARAWGNSSGQVGIPGAGIGLESDIELASPVRATISDSTTTGTQAYNGTVLTAGSIQGRLRVSMDPISIKLKAYVELFWRRWRYTLLNWRLDRVISRSWSL